MKKKPEVSPEQALKQVRKIFKQRGTKALEMARREILEEKIESEQIREALHYFMTKYWRDLTRSSLMSLACDGAGGNSELTTSIAVPMILISGAIDIHDDIIDQSRRKDGRLTVYGMYGKDVALLVGDALLFKGLTLLNKAWGKEISSQKIRIIIDVIKNTFFELGDAESVELHFRRSLDVSPEEYLRVLRKKAADVEAYTRVSAILAGASRKKIEALGEYGRLLGMLSILRDDWLDISDVEEVRSRIKKESLPLPLLYGLRHPIIKDRLRSVLLKKSITQKDAESILETIEKTDVHQKYTKLMGSLAEEAITKIRRAKVNNKELEIIAKATLL